MTRASTTLIWFSLTLFVSLGLYHTSYRVEELDRQLRGLNTEIEAEQRNLHVLKAEWVYLANPSRIEDAARKHLDLKPTLPRQVTGMNKISRLIPTHAEVVAKTTRSVSRRIASLAPRPAAHRPKVADEETGRLNSHLFIQTAQTTRTLPDDHSLRMGEDNTFTLANSGTEQ
ncbi:MAG: hypothetical protein PHD48_10865 [Alphaproteobacteria bacterium]|nr:hypothetical protein [Alphaproteobacteria bacterium]